MYQVTPLHLPDCGKDRCWCRRARAEHSCLHCGCGTPTTVQLAAFRDWLSGRAYLDNAGNYRLRPDGRATGSSRHVAPWNKAIKRIYPENAAFHRTAEAWRAERAVS